MFITASVILFGLKYGVTVIWNHLFSRSLINSRHFGVQCEEVMTCEIDTQCKLIDINEKTPNTYEIDTNVRTDGNVTVEDINFMNGRNGKRDVKIQYQFGNKNKCDMDTQCELISIKRCLTTMEQKYRRRDIETQCMHACDMSHMGTQCTYFRERTTNTQTAGPIMKTKGKNTQFPETRSQLVQCEIISTEREEDQPCCNPELTIKGQEQRYIRQLLSTKLNSMNIVIDQDMINDFVKQSVPRENQTNPYTLDQRFTTSLNKMVKEGYLPNKIDAPTKLNLNKKRGEVRFDRDLNQKYHRIQNKLLQLLIDENILKLPKNTHLDEGSIKKGSKSTPDCPSIPTGKFCDTVDDCTKICFNNHFRNTNALNQCSSVFNLRLLGDMCKENDLFKKTDFHTWKSHMHVLASFGALCCVLKHCNN
ncbi:uncharacterized protein LOC143058709 [Mytilus galloprovincialis]|uniref:uncharacterized protein LOC143058709 n=1 Tax=Mytilus galloprovincialis TaxID=29158 RepID=UPI003F7C3586